MRHHSCDLCGDRIAASGSPHDWADRPHDASVTHHTVEIRLRSPRPVLSEADLDQDALDSLADLLAREEAGTPLPDPADEADDRTVLYDLCPDCYARYRRDPLGIGWRNRLPFPSN